MHDKLLQSKAEIEGASKAIEKIKSEKKAYKQKIKVKNAVVLQQEQQIQQRQDHLDEQSRIINEIKRDCDRKELEIKDLTL